MSKTWVVYERLATGKVRAIHIVCDSAEWARLAGDGGYRLVQDGIVSEAEAERVARDALTRTSDTP